MGFKQRTFILGDDHDDADYMDHSSADEPQPQAVAPMQLGNIRKFSLQELEVATHDFSGDVIVGSGGFGVVYRGVLANGSVVAVKRLHPDMRRNISNWQTEGWGREFRREVEIGMMAQHPNLLRLLGFCFTKKEMCLIYPFIPGGSAVSHLVDLDWVSRNKIALGVASALSHLHDHCNRMIIHLDVKPANILLGESFEPLLADFGLAELMVKKQAELRQHVEDKFRPQTTNVNMRGQRVVAPKMEGSKQMWGVSCSYWSSSDAAAGSCRTKGVSCWYWSKIDISDIADSAIVNDYLFNIDELGLIKPGKVKEEEAYKSETFTSRIHGTLMYIAPEYAFEGRCSEKADVYGYGVTVCELVTGKRVYDFASESSHRNMPINYIMEGVKGFLMDSLVNLNSDNAEEMVQLKLTKVALLCMQTFPEHRPTMAEVTKMLEMDADGLASKWEQYWRNQVGPNSTNLWSADSTMDQVSHPWSADSTADQVPEELSGPR